MSRRFGGDRAQTLTQLSIIIQIVRHNNCAISMSHDLMICEWFGASIRTNLDFTEARDSEWQWHQLGHMQICTSPQTDHACIPKHSFLQAGCPFCSPTNSMKTLTAKCFLKCFRGRGSALTPPGELSAPQAP